MSMPTIPDIRPTIELAKEDVVNLLLSSIALEELGLAHIINAEGEKIQEVIKNYPSLDDLLKINHSVNKTLEDIIKKEILLQFKFENILELCDRKYDKDYKGRY